MLKLSLNAKSSEPLKILCLGSHSDDIEIGCGGTVLQISEQYPNSVFHWVVFNATGVREQEAQLGAKQFVKPTRLRGPVLKSFRDGFMPFEGAEIKMVFEDLKQAVSPDLIFTHHRDDAHQDHRLVAEMTWNTFRDHFILGYEIPKYDGDLGQPSFFVPLDLELCNKKTKLITETFQSQQNKRWFHQDTFLSLMRLRGMECNSPSGYAEAFYCRKVVL
jgi:LmbE family N-acetylglucosaminyl deacetylase